MRRLGSCEHFLTAACSIIALLVLPGLTRFTLASMQASDPIEFNRDIRPLLSEHCFACHGPDKNKRQADLRLDLESGLRGSQPGMAQWCPACRSKPVDRANRKRRYESADAPPEFGKPLSIEAKAMLREWVRQGGSFEGHWAFQPLRQQVAMKTANLPGPRSPHPIDMLIDVGIEKQKLLPAPQADKVTLIRRLSFDLIGLPPSPAEVQAFLDDDGPNAYSQLVERLLASEHFGERMAMWWLDLVRYADSVGYHGDQAMSVSPFRDYVIRAFNSNMPFDRFNGRATGRRSLGGSTIRIGTRTNRSRNGGANRTAPNRSRLQPVGDDERRRRCPG